MTNSQNPLFQLLLNARMSNIHVQESEVVQAHVACIIVTTSSKENSNPLLSIKVKEQQGAGQLPDLLEVLL